jgi:hypothetical protein
MDRRQAHPRRSVGSRMRFDPQHPGISTCRPRHGRCGSARTLQSPAAVKPPATAARHGMRKIWLAERGKAQHGSRGGAQNLSNPRSARTASEPPIAWWQASTAVGARSRNPLRQFERNPVGSCRPFAARYRGRQRCWPILSGSLGFDRALDAVAVTQLAQCAVPKFDTSFDAAAGRTQSSFTGLR